MSIEDSRTLTFEIITQLSELQSLARLRKNTELEAKIQKLREEIISLRCTVAVVGEFNRGKSTFINALLGRSILPADILPTTATVNRVTWGIKPSVTLCFREDSSPLSIPVEELEEHITKLTSETAERARSIKEAIVRWPLRFCREGIDVIDTPGLEDETTMTEITNTVLQSVDVALLVIMANAPFSETETMFLDQLLRSEISHIIVIVNAIDRIRRTSERKKILDLVRKRVDEQVQKTARNLYEADSSSYQRFMKCHESMTICPVSALDALEGREQNQPELLERSQMAEVEVTLDNLMSQSDRLALQSRVSAIVNICADLKKDISESTIDNSINKDHNVLVRRLGILTERGIECLDSDVRNIRMDIKLYITQYFQKNTSFMEMLMGDTVRILGNYEERLESLLDRDYYETVNSIVPELHAELRTSVSNVLKKLNKDIAVHIKKQEEQVNKRIGMYHYLLDVIAQEMKDIPCHRNANKDVGSLLQFEDITIMDLLDTLSISLSELSEIINDPKLKNNIEELKNIPSWKRMMSLDFDGVGASWCKLLTKKISEKYKTINQSFILTVTEYIDERIHDILPPMQDLMDAYKTSKEILIQNQKELQNNHKIAIQEQTENHKRLQSVLENIIQIQSKLR